MRSKLRSNNSLWTLNYDFFDTHHLRPWCQATVSPGSYLGKQTFLRKTHNWRSSIFFKRCDVSLHIPQLDKARRITPFQVRRTNEIFYEENFCQGNTYSYSTSDFFTSLFNSWTGHTIRQLTNAGSERRQTPKRDIISPILDIQRMTPYSTIALVHLTMSHQLKEEDGGIIF